MKSEITAPYFPTISGHFRTTASRFHPGIIRPCSISNGGASLDDSTRSVSKVRHYPGDAWRLSGIGRTRTYEQYGAGKLRMQGCRPNARRSASRSRLDAEPARPLRLRAADENSRSRARLSLTQPPAQRVDRRRVGIGRCDSPYIADPSAQRHCFRRHLNERCLYVSRFFFQAQRQRPLANVIPFPRPRRAVLTPVRNDDGHITGFDLGWITISRELAIRIVELVRAEAMRARKSKSCGRIVMQRDALAWAAPPIYAR